MRTLALLSILVQIGGFLMLLYFSSWQITLGIFLIVWGSNIESRYFNN